MKHKSLNVSESIDSYMCYKLTQIEYTVTLTNDHFCAFQIQLDVERSNATLETNQ